MQELSTGQVQVAQQLGKFAVGRVTHEINRDFDVFSVVASGSFNPEQRLLFLETALKQMIATAQVTLEEVQEEIANA